MSSKIREKVRANMALARKSKRLKQVDIAEALGVTVKSVSDWECGRSDPSYESIEMLAKIYGVDECWFHTYRPEANTPDTEAVTMTIDWAIKLTSLYEGMSANIPGMEPLPPALTQIYSDELNQAQPDDLPSCSTVICSAPEIDFGQPPTPIPARHPLPIGLNCLQGIYSMLRSTPKKLI